MFQLSVYLQEVHLKAMCCSSLAQRFDTAEREALRIGSPDSFGAAFHHDIYVLMTPGMESGPA